MISRWLHFLLSLFFLTAILNAQPGTELSQSLIPEKPASHVLDHAGLFQTNPKAREVLEKKLTDLQQKRGYPLYLVIENTLLNSVGAVEVERYQQAWIGDGVGLTVLMEADAGRFNVAQPQEYVRPLGSEAPSFLPSPLGINGVEVGIILGQATNAGQKAKKNDDKVALAVDFVGTFADGVDQIFVKRTEPTKDLTSGRLTALFVGAFALATMLFLIAYALMRRSEHKLHTRFVFPVMQVNQRLGAQYGGGKTVSRRF